MRVDIEYIYKSLPPARIYSSYARAEEDIQAKINNASKLKYCDYPSSNSRLILSSISLYHKTIDLEL